MPGECHISVLCDSALLEQEAGGHRIQRIPPTERRGRVHTSTVTVAVLRQEDCKQYNTSPSDFKIEWFSGTGAGGQHRNKHQNSARITHIPTGICETAQCRSRENSKSEAMEKLMLRLAAMTAGDVARATADTRKTQMGSGMRGDKIRTYRFQDDIATNHLTGAKCKASKLLDGHFELIW